MLIKVVSLNLWSGGKLFDEILDFLGKQDADIIALQEVYNGTDPTLSRQARSLQIIAQTLGYEHTSFAVFFRDLDISDGKAECGTAILSKFPIVNHNTTFFDGEYSKTYRESTGRFWECPHALLHTECQTPVGAIHAYNLHGVWDMDGDSYSDKRRHMADVVIKAVKDKQRVILAGDTNAKMTNQAILDIEQHLNNIFDRGLPTTFNMRHKDNPGYAMAAVDTIFVSHDVKVCEKTCHEDDISDHLALSALLEI